MTILNNHRTVFECGNTRHVQLSQADSWWGMEVGWEMLVRWSKDGSLEWVERQRDEMRAKVK